MKRRRQLFIILGGLLLLAVLTLPGTSLESWLPQQPSAALQNTQAGPYAVTLQVAPDPPTVGHNIELTLQIVQSGSHRLISHATVTVNATMQEMDMATAASMAYEVPQSPGLYHVQTQLSMRGAWTIDVAIARPSMPTEHAQFTLTAQ
jgi:hypothetical protein